MTVNKKREIEGVVVSSKMQNTVVVIVAREFRHPRYQKLIESRKKYYAHHEGQIIAEGSRVKLIESRPFSKLKRWKVIEILEQPKEGTSR